MSPIIECCRADGADGASRWESAGEISVLCWQDDIQSASMDADFSFYMSSADHRNIESPFAPYDRSVDDKPNAAEFVMNISWEAFIAQHHSALVQPDQQSACFV
jgi:hypothetical protein